MAKRVGGTAAPSRLWCGSRCWGLLLLSGALIWGGGWLALRLSDPALWPVTTVRLESRLEQLRPEEIRAVVNERVGGGVLSLDIRKIRRGLESLPWVATASVRHIWPDRLQVRIVERRAVARLDGGGLLTADDELFQPDEEQQQWEHLPLLRGSRQNGSLLQGYQTMQKMLAPLGVRIVRLTMNDRRDWELNLEGGLQLRLGRKDLHLRLLRFVRVYPEVLQPELESIEGVDLRYTNGFAVRWRNNRATSTSTSTSTST